MYQERRENYRGGGGNNRGYGNRNQQPRRNPLPEGFSLFYIAIVCPDNINAQVKQFKDHLEQTYGCRAAAKSPAHITVVPPFRAEDEMAAPIADFVQTFNMGMLPISINLKHYGNFGDRVLFIDVEPNPGLTALEQEAMSDFTQQFPSIIFGLKPDFNPHVTLATRDIPEGKLEEAKAYFETNFPFDETFTSNALRAFKLVNGWWQLI
jgi:2'-5' RNA ligase